MKNQKSSVFTLIFLVINFLFIFLPDSMAAIAVNYYVSNSGSDSNSGTIASPWRTIQKAANTAVPGSVVYVRGGKYDERITVNVSGSADAGYITFCNYPSETPIVDGTNVAVPAGEVGLFLVNNRNYIIIKGFEICNYKTKTLDRLPVGIHIRGSSNHIQILNNKIHNIEHNGTSSSGVDAHGIAVYGTYSSQTQSINNIVIDGNEVYSLKLGSSESIVVNGNVDGFTISNNKVHDNNNIGIDAIGFERVSSDPATDQARNGVISDNVVYNINSYGNPAYGTDRAADGIYVDGGRNIIIERNIVHHNNIGIELASEHAKRATSYVTVRNNFIYQNEVVGIYMGGYNTRRGSTEDCEIVNNTLFMNDTLKWGNGELQLQYNTRRNIIKNNIFFANSQNYFITNPFIVNTLNIVDFNIYYSQGGSAKAKWQWMKKWYTGLSAFRTGTGNDMHSLFVNPFFKIITSSPDLHLQVTSPAINRGEYLAQAGTIDIDKAPRMIGIIDIGADEFIYK